MHLGVSNKFFLIFFFCLARMPLISLLFIFRKEITTVSFVHHFYFAVKMGVSHLNDLIGGAKFNVSAGKYANLDYGFFPEKKHTYSQMQTAHICVVFGHCSILHKILIFFCKLLLFTIFFN